MRRKAVPWKNVSPEIEQVQFIKSWEQGRESFLELCQAFDISRKTGYKRVQRFKSLGWDGVGDQAGRPIAIPTGRTVAWRSVSSLPASITRPGDRRRWWPGSGTGSLTCPGRPPAPLETYWTGRGWCKDARGDAGRPPGANPLLPRSIPTTCGASTSRAGSALATGSGSIPSQWSMLPPVTSWSVTDWSGSGGPEVRRVMERAFKEHGLPQGIRSDNGPPFASVGLGGLSPLAVWWVKLGILPERTQPGHPEQNGRLERLHRTLKAETASPPQATPGKQQRSFDGFRASYNEERPHEALGQVPPAKRYRPSARAYPSRVESPEYETGTTVRRVKTNGEIKWHGGRVYLSESLRGEPVGLIPVDDRYWSIQFGPLHIGLLDGYANRTLYTPTIVLPMSPV